MYLGIDHLVIAVADPDVAAAELAATLGLSAGGGGRHDRLGTYNRLIWLGDTYLELIGVFDEALAGSSWVGAPTVRALAAGGGLATWAIATDAIETDVARLRSRGSDLSEPVAGERIRADGRAVRWRLAAAPRLGPDAPPFLIEHDPTGAEWSVADRAERARGTARLTTLEIGVEDVTATMRHGLRTVDLRFRPSLSGRGARDSDVGTHTVRLRPRRGDSEPAATVHLGIPGAGPLDVALFGCRWLVRP
ncbi:MAG: VOC family protein [Chloroflexota bacterium]|nr:VOC family protein [Chloroflexota bacterium]